MALGSAHAPGATPLDPNELADLIPDHLTTQRELNEWEQSNIIQGQEWAIKSRRSTFSDLLDDHFLKLLHKRMFDKTWKWAGEYRKSDKNIGIDWMQIPVQVRNASEDAKVWVDKKVYEPRELAVRFHHQIVKIHPFPNGNGRHARLVADLLLMKYYKVERLGWSRHDLTAHSESRARYISALRDADKGDFDELIQFAEAG